MASDLRSYSTSRGFITATQSMRIKSSCPKMYLYVEDDLDKAFWRKVFIPYSKEYDIEISVFKNLTGENIPGKDYMLKCVDNQTLKLSSRVMCCVDADYDLIVNIPEKYSDLVRNNIYIIHTHWYSMENLKCFPQGQYEDFAYRVSLPVEKISFDFMNCLKETSILLSKMILFTILDKKLNLSFFSIKDLKSFISNVEIYNQDLTIRQSFIQAVQTKEQLFLPYINTHKAEYDTIENTLKSQGYTPEKYFCIMQGHTLFDNIASVIVRVVAEPIRRSWLSSLTGTPEQKRQSANHYANNTGVNDDNHESLDARIKSLFRDNYNFERTEAYSMIQKQIDRALASGMLLSLLEAIPKRTVTKN